MKPSKEISQAIDFSYKEDYENIVNSSGYFSRIVYKKSHKSLERFGDEISRGRLLELGAQADQHRLYVKGPYDLYVVSDINLDLLQSQEKMRKDAKQSFAEIRYEKIDALSIPYADNSFDRIVATCLIAHLNNPIDALNEWRRVVRPGGQIDFYVACEPGIVLRLARLLTHKRVKRLSPYPYDLLQYAMHVNHFPALREFIKFVFKSDEIRGRFFPFPFLTWNFNLWAIYSVKVEK